MFSASQGLQALKVEDTVPPLAGLGLEAFTLYSVRTLCGAVTSTQGDLGP